MIEHKNKILEVFPEMAEAYSIAEKELANPGCKGCKKSKVIRKVKEEYARLSKLFPLRDMSSLPKIEAIQQLENPISEDHRAPFQDIRRRREYCKDCVLKHLAAAYTCNTETVLGYREHHNEATSHVELAYSFADKDTQRTLLPVVMANHLYRNTDDLQHLKRSHAIIKAVLDTITSEDCYRVIGHLVHAEEECWQGDVELANKIREERLRVMADKNYIPDLLPLLKEVDELVSSK